MGQAFMFSALDEEETQTVIMAMECMEFKAGDDVIKQGGDGDYFYVVYKGELDCHKLYKGKDEPTYLLTYKSG
jgi:cAMP-dependent protein kinase regulator